MKLQLESVCFSACQFSFVNVEHICSFCLSFFISMHKVFVCSAKDMTLHKAVSNLHMVAVTSFQMKKVFMM